MFEKLKIKRQIKRQKRIIKLFEQKRMRSQAAITEAIIAGKIPEDKDTDYFNRYTEQIGLLRAKIQTLQEQIGEKPE